MSHRKGEKPAPGRPRETTDSPQGKQLLREAWECGQKVNRTTRTIKHTIDLFSSELQALRRKVREKSSQLVLLCCPSSPKAEELLWKKTVYDVVQRCKQHKQALDGSSDLYVAYCRHLSSSVALYGKLLQKLEAKYGVTLTSGASTGLDELSRAGSAAATAAVLKEVCYRCLLHMGDIARYQIDVGGTLFAAVAYYHHAIALDSTQGAPFNQLAAMVGNKNEYLDSVYYYQRSITSAQPFEGSESNLQTVYATNKETLDLLTVEMRRAKEPNIKELTRKILIAQFIQLQYFFSPNKRSTLSADDSLGTLCEEVITHLEECLQVDFEQFREECSSVSVKPSAAPGSSAGPSDVTPQRQPSFLPPELLLKVAALSILSSHSLRLLGSTLTPAATAFALSVFSQFLEYSHRRLACILLSSMIEPTRQATFSPERSKLTLDGILESSESMLDIVLRESSTVLLKINSEVPAVVGTDTSPIVPLSKSSPSQSSKKLQPPSKAGVKSTLGGPKEKHKRLKKVVMINRRRRRPAKHGLSSDEEEEDGTSGSEVEGHCLSRSSSEDSLVLLSESIGEDDLEMLESFSDASSSDDSDSVQSASSRSSQQSALTPPPSKKDRDSSPLLLSSTKARRKIVLAANFDFPSQPPTKEVEDASNKSQIPTLKLESSARGMKKDVVAVFPSADDDLLLNLVEETRQADAVHTVCSLVASDSNLICLKMFAEWLQSYPVVIATCAQSSSTIWSRLATLLNFLPTGQELASAGIDVGKHQSTALLEDVALRGFAPLARSQADLQFGTTPSNLEQAIARIRYLHTFGHYVASAKTAPSFNWDASSEKYVGPAQKLQQEAQMARQSELQEHKKAERSRSKLMKAMAQQRLQSEVATLAEASKEQAAIFTPYLLPDAHTLCSALHLVKKLMKTEKFVFIISKSVIESLDSMKKGRENYTAREAIKFLEREFKNGSKFMRAQQPSETLQQRSAMRKPARMELPTWHFKCLVDCAAYINQSNVQAKSTMSVVTLLLERRVCQLLADVEEQARHPQMTEVVQYAQQCGLEIDNLLDFYESWQAQLK